MNEEAAGGNPGGSFVLEALGETQRNIAIY